MSAKIDVVFCRLGILLRLISNFDTVNVRSVFACCYFFAIQTSACRSKDQWILPVIFLACTSCGYNVTRSNNRVLEYASSLAITNLSVSLHREYTTCSGRISCNIASFHFPSRKMETLPTNSIHVDVMCNCAMRASSLY